VSPASIPLAILRKNQGKYSEAKRILKKAVAARERVDGPEAQSVAIALSELGDVLRRVREYQDSEVAFRRSLLIRERYLGDRHPRFASNLFGLGRLYFDQDGTSQAEQLFRRARDIFERSFGPQTIAIARCDAELGRAYIRGGRPEEAERALRPAVATLEAQLTVGHPTTIRTLRLYAEALRNVANIADAEVAERRAAEGLTIMDKTAVIEQ
jgi:tetratricopeptide (TPR) repeat protein